MYVVALRVRDAAMTHVSRSTSEGCIIANLRKPVKDLHRGYKGLGLREHNRVGWRFAAQGGGEEGRERERQRERQRQRQRERVNEEGPGETGNTNNDQSLRWEC